MRQRPCQSSLERLVDDALRAFPQYEVRRQVRLGRYRVDFLLGRLVIEVLGSWTHTFPTDRAKDARRTQYLHERGYEVVEITEEQINALSPLGLIDYLDDVLRRYEHAALLPTRCP